MGFRFTIQFLDDLDGKATIESGIVMANSYENGLARLIECVGKDNFIGVDHLY